MSGIPPNHFKRDILFFNIKRDTLFQLFET